jgi:hypothetical protein
MAVKTKALVKTNSVSKAVSAKPRNVKVVKDIVTDTETRNNRIFADVVDCYYKNEYRRISLGDLEGMNTKALVLIRDENIRRFTQSQRIQLLKASQMLRDELVARQMNRSSGFMGFLRGIFH